MKTSEPFTPARLSRRNFLSGSAAVSGLAAVAGPTRSVEPAASDRVAFFVVGDTHFLADKESPAKLDPRSAEICGNLIDTLNRLPGAAIPESAGGGRVVKPAGLIHAGDVIDTGDKTGRVQNEMQRTEWSAFSDEFGLTGTDGRLSMPVYEIFGNHDAPHGTGLALEKIKERNKHRPAVVNVSDNGVHYSWDWGKVHFINLGIVVGASPKAARKRRYEALGSLDFLQADLRDQVGASGSPVVITHHVDIARYTGPCDPTGSVAGKEWDPCDVRAFYDALSGFNVANVYGHTHARDVYRWDGLSKNTASGLSVFNVDNSSHFHGPKQAFFYVELADGRLTVREYATSDGWRTGDFTPQAWTSTHA